MSIALGETYARILAAVLPDLLPIAERDQTLSHRIHINRPKLRKLKISEFSPIAEGWNVNHTSSKCGFVLPSQNVVCGLRQTSFSGGTAVSQSTSDDCSHLWINRLMAIQAMSMNMISSKISRFLTSTKLRLGFDPRTESDVPGGGGLKRLVILGAGWGCFSVLENIDITKYDVTVVSPRNFLTFTPMLPSACSGSLSTDVCATPVRKYLLRGGKPVMQYHEGEATDVDFDRKSISCVSHSGMTTEVPYDYLILAVGNTTATFGIPGVKENAYFLKHLEHATAIRQKLLRNLERASFPGVSEVEKSHLLSIAVVGGGPTGVEVAAELADFMNEEVPRMFPSLKPYVNISLVEMLPKVLPMFSDEVSSYSLVNLQKCGIKTFMESRVTKVCEDSVSVLSKNKSSGLDEPLTLDSALTVWASGVEQLPLCKTLLGKIKVRQGGRILKVDPRLRLYGVDDVFAIGDCAVITPPKLADKASELFSEASESCASGAGTDFVEQKAAELIFTYPQLNLNKWSFKSKPRKNNMTVAEFHAYLSEIDTNYKPPPPSAQFASQEGIYISSCLNSADDPANAGKAAQSFPPFVENWQGYTAYVGGGNAVCYLPWANVMGGITSTLLWRSVYITLQKSVKNQFKMVCEWVANVLGGRSTVREHSEKGYPPYP